MFKRDTSVCLFEMFNLATWAILMVLVLLQQGFSNPILSHLDSLQIFFLFLCLKTSYFCKRKHHAFLLLIMASETFPGMSWVSFLEWNCLKKASLILKLSSLFLFCGNRIMESQCSSSLSMRPITYATNCILNCD